MTALQNETKAVDGMVKWIVKLLSRRMLTLNQLGSAWQGKLSAKYEN